MGTGDQSLGPVSKGGGSVCVGVGCFLRILMKFKGPFKEST